MLRNLEKVDLKTIWENKAYNFTPWIAQKENLELLEDTIVIELALKAQEKSVGPFRADILCKNTAELKLLRHHNLKLATRCNNF